MNHELHMAVLRPHDVAVALQLLLTPGLPCRDLAKSVGHREINSHALEMFGELVSKDQP